MMQQSMHRAFSSLVMVSLSNHAALPLCIILRQAQDDAGTGTERTSA